jgi:hypothetical protein
MMHCGAHREAKWWRFPQGSLPKTASHAYLDEKSTEL